MRGITARLMLTMLAVALATVAVPALVTWLAADRQVREPSPQVLEFRALIDSAVQLCNAEEAAPAGLNCPSGPIQPRKSSSNSEYRSSDYRGGSGRSRRDPFDPRPWTQSAVLSGAGAAAALAVLLALLLSRRIALPVRAVSVAAKRVAEGNLGARAQLPKGFERSGDELASLAHNFNRMAEHLERQERARRAQFADIAHELRTPIAAMRAKLETLEDGVIPLDMQAVTRLSHQTRLLERLVEDLRLVSLADAGALTLETSRVNLTQLAQESLETFSARAASSNVHLELCANEAIWHDLDPHRIQQVIGNLLENAIHHTPNGGTVMLEVAQGHPNVTLRVLDTGPGLPEDALERVWDRLYRQEASRSRETGGSGLGLAIVKAIAELHGGSVTAANRPEGGAVFTVRLGQARGIGEKGSGIGD